MKIMKSYRQWIPVVAIPVLVVSGAILYFSTAAVHFFKIHWLALAAVGLIACLPLGKQRLAAHAEETPRYALWGWLGQVLGLQLCVGAVFAGVSVVCAQSAALATAQPTPLSFTFTQLLVSEGLFPWAFCALTAACLGYYSYCQRQDAYWATTVSGLINHPTAQVIINFTSRLATLLAYGGTFSLLSLLWISATTSPILPGFGLTPILVSVILLLLSLTKIYRRNLTKSLGKDLPLTGGLFLWVAFFAVAIWLVNGFLAPLTQSIVMPSPSLLNHWLRQPWQNLWLIFANSWWVLWTPMLGVTLARLSRGRQIRELIAAVLALPLLCGVILVSTHSVRWDMRPLPAAVIAGVGLLGLLGMTLSKKGVAAFILVYLPRQDHYKFRSYRSTFVKVLQIAVAFLFIYLPGGMTVTHFLAFAAALPLVLISLISIAAMVKCSSNSTEN